MHIPHNKLTLLESQVESVTSVLRSGQWAAGEKVRLMESSLCEVFKYRHAVGVGSGVAALRLALLSLNVTENDEVIVPAYSCVALANAVMSLGAKPVPVDVSRDDWNLDVDSVKQALGRRTRAVIVVNTFGCPARVREIQAMGVPVIEDISHGFALDDHHSPEPGVADLSVVSFYATKLIGGGEGGAVMTNSNAQAEFVRDWHDYTDKPADGRRLNDKMTDIEATLVCCQLNSLQDLICKRTGLANRYTRMLSGQSGLSIPIANKNRVWYRYVVQMPENKMDDVTDLMQKSGVSVCKPIDSWIVELDNRFQNTLTAFNELLSLPLYPRLEDTQLSYICECLSDSLKT
ncbi:MAG: DegT/DnrJ/EryC1/StrS family aminotransferase [Pseudomonadota bacterium]